MASKYLHLEKTFLACDRWRDATGRFAKQSGSELDLAEPGPHLAVYKIDLSTLSSGMPVIHARRRRRKRSVS